LRRFFFCPIDRRFFLFMMITNIRRGLVKRQQKLPHPEELPASLGWRVTSWMLGPYFSVAEAARKTRCTRATLYKRFHQGWCFNSSGKLVKD
jgi:hypothetical protein